MNNEEFHKQLEYMKQQRDENIPKAISLSEFQEKLFNKIFDDFVPDYEIYNIIKEVYRDELNHYIDDDRIYLKFHIIYDYILKGVPRHRATEYEVRIENVTFYIQGAGADRLYKNIKMSDIVLFGGTKELSRTGKDKLEDIICSHKLPLFIYEVGTEQEDNNRCNRWHTTCLLYYKMR